MTHPNPRETIANAAINRLHPEIRAGYEHPGKCCITTGVYLAVLFLSAICCYLYAWPAVVKALGG